MEPTIIFGATLVFSWIMYVWEEYLSWRQFRKVVENETLPEDCKELMSEEDFQKSRSYKIDRTRFEFVHSAYGMIFSTLVLWFEILPIMWYTCGSFIESQGYTHEIIHTSVFLAVVMVLSTVIELPWKLYDTFVIEQKHGFNKQTLGFFAKDQVKKVLVMTAIAIPIMDVLVVIIQKGGDYFFVYVWIFMAIVTLFLLTIYPEFIAPLFDKYTPLKEGSLREKIEALASKLKFPLTKLYVVEGSKRSAHSNAYLFGFWNKKRIVLYDTLIQDYEPEKKEGEEEGEGETEKKEPERKKLGMQEDEVVAVLGHELGHWQLNHTIYQLVISEVCIGFSNVNQFLIFFLFGLLYQRDDLYQAFGFHDSKPTIIGLMIIFQYIFAPYNELLSFFMTWFTRKMEFAADAFSADLGYATLMQAALIKLGKDNLSFPINDWLYSFCHHDHPPIPERVEVLKKWE